MGVEILSRIDRDSPSLKVTFGQRLARNEGENEMSQEVRKRLLGRGNSKCRGPVARV